MADHAHGRDAPVAAILLAVIVGAAVAGLITYTEDDLTLAGRSLVAVAGAGVGSLAVFAMYRSAARTAALTGIAISLILGGGAFVFLRDAAPPGVMGFSGGC